MNDVLKEFISHLENELKAYAALRDILNEEREALIRWDLDEATVILFKKEEVLSEIKQIEKARIRVSMDVGKELFPDKNDDIPPTLQSIIDIVGKKDAENLTKFRERQIEIVNSVRDLNARNSLLMRRTMELISASLDVLTGGESAPIVYDINGERQKRQISSKIVDGRL